MKGRRSGARRVVPVALAVTVIAGLAPAQRHGAGPRGEGRAPGAETPPPNVLIVVLDDVGIDKLAVYDQTPLAPDVFAFTPTIDALAGSGITFTSFHATPVCSSTRAWIQTGRFGFRHGVHTYIDIGGTDTSYVLPSTEVTLAEHLRDAWPAGANPGYARAAFGKWHLTPQDPVHACHPIQNGYEVYAGNLGNFSDHFAWPRVESRWMSGSWNCLVAWPPGAIETEWSATRVRRDAVDWISAQAGPFFAYVSFHPPHWPFQVPPLGLLPPATVAELAAAGLDQPGFEVKSKFPCAGPDPQEAYEARLVFRAMLEAVDSELALLLAAVPPNTAIFLMGDNGTPENVMQIDVGAPAMAGPPYAPFRSKRWMGHAGCRVPLIVSGPVVGEPGSICTGLASATDLFATVTELAGALPPADPDVATDSVSFAHLLADPTAPSGRTWAFMEYRPDNATVWNLSLGMWEDRRTGALSPTPPGPYWRALTDGTWRYVRTHSASAISPCPQPPPLWCPAIWWTEALYDLAADPNETANLFCAPPPGGAAALATLSLAMDQLPCPCP